MNPLKICVNLIWIQGRIPRTRVLQHLCQWSFIFTTFHFCFTLSTWNHIYSAYSFIYESNLNDISINQIDQKLFGSHDKIAKVHSNAGWPTTETSYIYELIVDSPWIENLQFQDSTRLNPPTVHKYMKCLWFVNQYSNAISQLYHEIWIISGRFDLLICHMSLIRI